MIHNPCLRRTLEVLRKLLAVHVAALVALGACSPDDSTTAITQDDRSSLPSAFAEPVANGEDHDVSWRLFVGELGMTDSEFCVAVDTEPELPPQGAAAIDLKDLLPSDKTVPSTSGQAALPSNPWCGPEPRSLEINGGNNVVPGRHHYILGVTRPGTDKVRIILDNNTSVELSPIENAFVSIIPPGRLPIRVEAYANQSLVDECRRLEDAEEDATLTDPFLCMGAK